MFDATVMLPVDEHFPDPYDKSEEAVIVLFRRIANRMSIDPNTIELDFFDDSGRVTRELMPYASGEGAAPAGLYHHDSDAKTHVLINTSQLKSPDRLIATLAHEIGHVILLRPGLVEGQEEDMEPLNDLLTVFLGFGVFNANSAFQFKQFSNDRTQGWSVNRQGYLSEEVFGYALARFAFERGEMDPPWVKYLATNIRAYFKRSLAWLNANGNRLFDRSTDEAYSGLPSNSKRQ